MNVVEMGKAGLAGSKGKLVHKVSKPVARRTGMSRDQVEAIVGGIFLTLLAWQVVGTLRRVWAASGR
ncbi:MAG TPA: hypothetical protein VM638_05485 [Actinomycetota bacterium]|nr:hypothetical protein [Actinomycetota bacterium]